LKALFIYGKTIMTEKHVFTELVKHKRDVPGMLAYGLYKTKKKAEAKSLSERHKTKLQIKAEMIKYHNRIANNTTEIGDYIEAGQLFFDEMIGAAKAEERQKMENEISTRVEKIKTEWLKKVDLQRIDDQNSKIILYWNSFWTAITAGVRKYIVGAIILALASYFGLDKYLEKTSQKQDSQIEQKAAE
jgi:hypothetical protein